MNDHKHWIYHHSLMILVFDCAITIIFYSANIFTRATAIVFDTAIIFAFAITTIFYTAIVFAFVTVIRSDRISLHRRKGVSVCFFYFSCLQYNPFFQSLPDQPRLTQVNPRVPK